MTEEVQEEAVEILKHSPVNNYKLLKKSGRATKVVEIPTGFVLFESKNMDEVKPMFNRLNNGGGFAGLTPAFFMQRIKIKEATSKQK